MISKFLNKIFRLSKKHKKNFINQECFVKTKNVCEESISIILEKLETNKKYENNKLKNEVFDILRNQNNWINSNKIIEKLSIKISGPHLRKIIANLRNEGIAIIANQNGYLITKNDKEIKKYVDSRIKEIEYEKRILFKLYK